MKANKRRFWRGIKFLKGEEAESVVESRVGTLEKKTGNMVGTVTPFDSQSHSWEEYCSILQYFFKANDITEADKQKACWAL